MRYFYFRLYKTRLRWSFKLRLPFFIDAGTFYDPRRRAIVKGKRVHIFELSFVPFRGSRELFWNVLALPISEIFLKSWEDWRDGKETEKLPRYLNKSFI